MKWYNSCISIIITMTPCITITSNTISITTTLPRGDSRVRVHVYKGRNPMGNGKNVLCQSHPFMMSQIYWGLFKNLVVHSQSQVTTNLWGAIL